MIDRRQLIKAGMFGMPLPFIASKGLSANKSQPQFKWRMVTSWPKNLPGPGVTAQRLVDRINTMSNGRLEIRLYAANELLPALEVFNAVSLGKVEMGHSASFFWQGIEPASVFFTTIPFGLTALEHIAWIEQAKGQELWDRLYSKHNIKPFMAGNTGMGMGGWFKKPILSASDIKGLKIRMPGIGGEVLTKLGATTVLLSPQEIFPALEKGVIDAAEFLGPWSDSAFGFYKAAPYYYWPGYHKPNGTAECLINKKSYQSLPNDLKEIVKNACQAENIFGLSESEWNNALFLQKLRSKPNLTIAPLPKDILEKANKILHTLLIESYQKTPLSKEILHSYLKSIELSSSWSKISSQAFFQARQ